MPCFPRIPGSGCSEGLFAALTPDVKADVRRKPSSRCFTSFPPASSSRRGWFCCIALSVTRHWFHRSGEADVVAVASSSFLSLRSKSRSPGGFSVFRIVAPEVASMMGRFGAVTLRAVLEGRFVGSCHQTFQQFCNPFSDSHSALKRPVSPWTTKH